MKIKTAFILAAGKGTRMGPIGKVLPKPCWPLFESSLLEVQVRLASKRGIERFFINAHHQSILVEQEVEKLQTLGFDVTLVYEEELLDVGGAVYHLIQNYELKDEAIVLLNGDLFYHVDSGWWNDAATLLKSCDVVLAGLPVERSQGYNRVVTSSLGKVEAIEKNVECRLLHFETYAGISMIKLTSLDQRKGKHPFFHSVANYSSRDVRLLTPKNGEYWDFGTINLYLAGHQKLLREKNSTFVRELYSLNVIQADKVWRDEGYGPQDAGRVINLSGESCLSETDEYVMILKKPSKVIAQGGVYFGDLFSPTSLRDPHSSLS